MSTPISEINPAAFQPYRGTEKNTAVAGNRTEAPGPATPAYRVSLSRDALDASADGGGSVAGAGPSSSGKPGEVEPGECETCSNRKYVDVSTDSTVSFQTPTKVSPGAAESMVRAHEQEHVTNEQARATEEGAEVVAQNVSIRYSICPECGRSFVAGGITTTVTKSDDDQKGQGNGPEGNFSVIA